MSWRAVTGRARVGVQKCVAEIVCCRVLDIDAQGSVHEAFDDVRTGRLAHSVATPQTEMTGRTAEIAKRQLFGFPTGRNQHTPVIPRSSD